MEWAIGLLATIVGLLLLSRHESRETGDTGRPAAGPVRQTRTREFRSPEELMEACAIFEQNRNGREMERHIHHTIVLTDLNAGYNRNWEGWNHARVFFNHPIPKNWSVLDRRSPSECGPSPMYRFVEPLVLREERYRRRSKAPASGTVHHGGRYTR